MCVIGVVIGSPWRMTLLILVLICFNLRQCVFARVTLMDHGHMVGWHKQTMAKGRQFA